MTKYFVFYLLFIMASPLASIKLIRDYKDIKKIPKMIIMDLDYTLWPFRVDDLINSPFYKNDLGKIVDIAGKVIEPYPESLNVLEYIWMNKINVCAASRTEDTEGAEQLINLFGWKKYLRKNQIYPGTKRRHIKMISKIFQIELRDILLFDDEYHNIVDLEHMGVICVLEKQGMTMKALMDGIRTYSDRRIIDQLSRRPPP